MHENCFRFFFPEYPRGPGHDGVLIETSKLVKEGSAERGTGLSAIVAMPDVK